MQMKKRVFVTGHLGYIGAQLVDVLKAAGHYVTGCDINLFEECLCAPFTPADHHLIRDICTVAPRDLEGYDCVMHLAAISNDPMGELDAQITQKINYHGTVALAQAAKQAGVPLFLFASSCSIYGTADHVDIRETDATAPLTNYAASKIQSEEALISLSDERFQVGLLRNATAYGFSPRLRIDLVVNNLLASALAYGEMRVMSDGTPWRPLIHCRDIARAFLAWMDFPPKEIALALNIGSNSENYQVRDIVQKIQPHLPLAKVVFTGEIGADPRNYRVNFDLLQKKIPQFQCSYTLEQGIVELLEQFHHLGFSSQDFESGRFVRLQVLKRKSEAIQKDQQRLRQAYIEMSSDPRELQELADWGILESESWDHQ